MTVNGLSNERGNEMYEHAERDAARRLLGMDPFSTSERLDELATSIQAEGIREPVLLGNDGRVWDGHHRIVVAMRLGIESVPVEVV